MLTSTLTLHSPDGATTHPIILRTTILPPSAPSAYDPPALAAFATGLRTYIETFQPIPFPPISATGVQHAYNSFDWCAAYDACLYHYEAGEAEPLADTLDHLHSLATDDIVSTAISHYRQQLTMYMTYYRDPAGTYLHREEAAQYIAAADTIATAAANGCTANLAPNFAPPNLVPTPTHITAL